MAETRVRLGTQLAAIVCAAGCVSSPAGTFGNVSTKNY